MREKEIRRETETIGETVDKDRETTYTIRRHKTTEEKSNQDEDIAVTQEKIAETEGKIADTEEEEIV